MGLCWTHRAIVGVLAGAALSGWCGEPDRAALDAGTVGYRRDVLPILANRCFKCHGPDEAARQGSLRLDTPEGMRRADRHGRAAVVPGEPGESQLLLRVLSDDPEERMPPPDSKLPAVTAPEAEVLRRWIAQGAPWEEHWSLVAPEERAAPAAIGRAGARATDRWGRGVIDSWVMARLDAEGLAPSPEAPPETLLRRASLDLIGLPPTLEEQDRYMGDAASDPDGAYLRAVDRLLSSARFGEKWARWWLDLARYADSMGYEKDRGRTIWPYRDWVIRSLNADMGFDRFTQLQLAGDLVAAATEAERDEHLVATAFHRNTMTNDEGGTDDEEFRVAAVVDRVNTTMEVWQGLTMSCAQCHTHKYDPLLQTDYYRLFAIFNNTADADRGDDGPTMLWADPSTKERLKALEAQIAAAERDIDEDAGRTGGRDEETERRRDGGEETRPANVASGREEDAASATHGVGAEQRAGADREAERRRDTLEAGGGARDRVWVDDLLPPGAVEHIEGAGASDGWPWVDGGAGPVAPARGTRTFGATFAGQEQRYFTDAFPALPVGAGDTLFAYVWLDPADPPRTIMFQWFAPGGGWEHRAYWGDPAIRYGGVEGTASRLRIGELPEPGRWVRLEAPASSVGLEGQGVTGWAFSQFGGRVLWDAAGVGTVHAWDDAYLRSMEAWAMLARANEGRGLPENVRAIVMKAGAEPGVLRDGLTPEEGTALRSYYLRRVHEKTRLGLFPREAAIAALQRQRSALMAGAVRVPVMQELDSDRRVTHRFERGSFLSPAEEVTPGVPEVLEARCEAIASAAGLAPGSVVRPRDRRELAAWLTSAQNPLTARVIANRVWEQLFGVGIVETVEDFGTQGAPPSHPELLDHLAVSLRQHGWSLKSLIREIVTSATYRQSSAAPEELYARDPYNRLLARGARFRLDGETIRDQALAASGLLSDKMYGPPVYPPQPEGLWNMVIYSGERWDTSGGEDRHRRGIYTFWRRTVPYPSMTTFDAPSREFCVSRRIRTDTPLQAYVTLNDPAFVECAAALEERVRNESREQREENRAEKNDKVVRATGDAGRVEVLFRLVLGRRPSGSESAELLKLVADQRARYAADPEAAAKVVGRRDGETERPGEGAENDAERAAWVSACSVVLNLDEALTRE